MKEEWGDWIEHDQSGVPSAVLGQFIEVVCWGKDGWISQDKFHHPAAPLSEDWSNVWRVGYCSTVSGQWLVEIARYRIRKPRGMTILEALIADLPASVEMVSA